MYLIIVYIILIGVILRSSPPSGVSILYVLLYLQSYYSSFIHRNIPSILSYYSSIFCCYHYYVNLKYYFLWIGLYSTVFILIDLMYIFLRSSDLSRWYYCKYSVIIMLLGLLRSSFTGEWFTSYVYLFFGYVRLIIIIKVILCTFGTFTLYIYSLLSPHFVC